MQTTSPSPITLGKVHRALLILLALAIALLSAYYSSRPAPSTPQTPASPPPTANVPATPRTPTNPTLPTPANAPDRSPPIANEPADHLSTVAFTALPPQAQQTIHLIDKGGPFPYRQDGVIFENRERRLPLRPTDAYHEFTVISPGSPDRGPRRIIAGPSGLLYYTADHYATFQRVLR